MKLIIVESPNKCKIIKSFLGPEYEVMASYGYIRLLGHSISEENLAHEHEPDYLIEQYKHYIKPLQIAAKSATVVYLALDDDIEGEAIAWHLSQVLKLDTKTNPRVFFNEINKKVVTNALANPSVIDMDKVTQQGRQILDRWRIMNL